MTHGVQGSSVKTRKKKKVSNKKGLIMDAAFVRVLRIALGVLTDRLITLTALVMAFALACWAMWGPAHERLVMAGFFAVCVYLPALLKEKKRETERNNDESGE